MTTNNEIDAILAPTIEKMTRRLSMTALYEYVMTLPVEHDIRAFMGLDDDCDDPRSIFNYTMFAETCKNIMQYAGIEIDGDTLILKNGDTHVMRRVAELVQYEYDNVLDPHQKMQMTWTFFDLGGDDDVDYNGTHVEMACDVIDAFIAARE